MYGPQTRGKKVNRNCLWERHDIGITNKGIEWDIMYMSMLNELKECMPEEISKVWERFLQINNTINIIL